MLVKNPGPHHRVYPHLTNPETGRTLELAPGQKVELDLPEDFEDFNLVPAEHEHEGVRRRARRHEKETTDDPAPSSDNGEANSTEENAE